MTKAVNDWTIIPLGPNKSKFVMKREFRSKGLMGTIMNGMMQKKMNETLLTVLNDAKVFAETGEISEAKQKRVEQLQKKNKAA